MDQVLFPKFTSIAALQKSNEVWKKNRNSYARLLLEQLKAGRLEEPFSAMPPSSPLPVLPKSLTYAYSKLRSPSGSISRSKTPTEQLDSYLQGQRAGSDARPQSPLPYFLGADLATPSCGMHHDFEMTAECDTGNVMSTVHRQPGHTQWSFAAPHSMATHSDAAGQDELAQQLAQTEQLIAEHAALTAQLDQQQFQEQMLHSTPGTAPVAALPEWHTPGIKLAAPPLYDHDTIKAVIHRADSLKLPSSTRRESSTVATHAREHVAWGDELPGILTGFKERTRVLKKKLSRSQTGASLRLELGGGPPASEMSPISPLPPFDLRPLVLDLPSASQQAGSAAAESSRRPKNAVKIDVRHTRKSAAAAAIRASQREAAKADEVPRLRPAQTGVLRGLGGAIYKLYPDVTTGSTSALIAEVAALRQKLAANVARLDAQQKAGALGSGAPSSVKSVS